MGPFEAQAISVVFGVLGSVTALGMIMRFMLRRKELEVKSGDADLAPAVDALRDELHDVRAQLTEVHERLDFAERLLTEGRASRGPTGAS